MADLTPKQVADYACKMLTDLTLYSMRAGRDGHVALTPEIMKLADGIISSVTLLQQYAESGSHVGASNQTGAAP